MRKLKIQVVGTFALMMHQMTAEVLGSLASGVRLEIKKDLPDRDVAAKCIYRDDEGKVCLPSTMLLAALVEAGRSVSYQGKTNISTAESTKLHALMRIEEEYLLLPVPEGKTEPDWVVDKRRGQLENGTAVCVRRPKFKDWGFTATVVYDETMVSQDKIEKLFEVAGKFQGLGSFRPNRRGPFGSFAVQKIEDITPEDWKHADTSDPVPVPGAHDISDEDESSAAHQNGETKTGKRGGRLAGVGAGGDEE